MKPVIETLRPFEELRHIHANFLQELEAAHTAYRSGVENTTSLPFIANQLPLDSVAEDNELFTVLVIGGTVGSKAICAKTSDGVAIIEQRPEAELPSFGRGEEFVAYVDTLIQDDTRLASINFAYPMAPVTESGILDGILLDVDETNAFHARDLIGKRIGEEVSRYIREQRKREVTVSVGNDGVCLLLSGKVLTTKDNLAFSVIGTGLNAGFLLDGTAINLESSGFDKFPQTRVGKELTKVLGYPFGKEINGSCLYRHFNAEIEEKEINFPLLSSTKELSEVSMIHDSVVSSIAQKHLNRSAQLVACQTAAIADFKGEDMLFVMEGSLFWKGNKYKETVAETVVELSRRKVQFVEIPNSGVLGAAQLLL